MTTLMMGFVCFTIGWLIFRYLHKTKLFYYERYNNVA